MITTITRWTNCTLALLSAACLGGLGAGCDEVEDDDLAGLAGADLQGELTPGTDLLCADEGEAAERCGPGLDRPYRHPFQGVALVDGQIPLLDRKNSPAGHRYAVMDMIGDLAEDGEAPRVVRSSAIVELPRRAMTAEELRERAAARAERARDRLPPPQTIAPQLERILAAADPGRDDEPLTVKINVVRPGSETLQQRMDRRIALGEVYSARDARRVRTAVLEDIRVEVARDLAPIEAAIAGLGGEVVYTCEVGHCLTARLGAAQLRDLAARPEIQRINVPGRFENFGGHDGVQMREAYQYRQFWDRGFDGENAGNPADITFAILEQEGFRNTHVSFNEGGGSLVDRIAGMFTCSNSSCWQVSGWASADAGDHATAALGSVMADWTDEQFAGTNVDQELSRGAPAREAQGYLYEVLDTPDSAMRAYNHLVQRSPAPALVSLSIGDVERDVSCRGEDDQSIDVDNLLYENGVLIFAAAGNEGGQSDDCRIVSPGAAAGAFTVGGHSGGTPASVCAARAAPISASSSWGGSDSTYAEGKRRTIVDLTGAYCQRWRSSADSDITVADACGTSFATPSVAGAAADLIDAYKHVRTDFIDDPGVLFTWMLAMGDRATTGFIPALNNRFGAGRVQLRIPDSQGMDAPWHAYTSWTCVDDGEIVTLPIDDGNALSSDIERMTVNAWWYDRRLEQGVPIDNIDLRVRSTDGTLVKFSNDLYDNKERIHLDPSGKAVEVQLVGTDVTSDGEGCGANSMKVYWQVMIEDDDRDDADGPTWDPANCAGIAPSQ